MSTLPKKDAEALQFISDRIDAWRAGDVDTGRPHAARHSDGL
jgi:hypothetical protein